MPRIYYFIIILLALSACKSHKAVEKTYPDSSVTSVAGNAISATGKEIQLVHLPVFIPTAQLQKQLYNNFFAPGYGKYYPCQDKPGCSDSYKDIYVENPVLKVNGDYMNIKLHVAGQATVLMVFHPDIEGDIELTAKPAVRNDTLFFEKVSMEKSSQNFLLKVASAFFEKEIIKKIQDNAWYAFRPALDKYTADYQKQMPLKWQESVLLLSLKKIYLNKVTLQQPPNDGIVVDFFAQLVTENAGYGQ